jgi:plastocyanin
MTVQRTAPASFVVLAVAAALLVALAVLAAPVRAATHAIDVRDGSFRTPELTISLGDTVTWTNNGDDIHNVVSEEGTPVAFDSGNMLAGDTFSFTFTQPGIYDYTCTFHSSGDPPTGMVGTITVAAGTTTPSTAMAGDQSASTLMRLIGVVGLIGVWLVVAGTAPLVVRRVRRR